MIEYPPHYERLVWDYNYTNQNAVALDKGDWNFLFFYKNVHKQLSILNRTSMNIFSKFILNKLVLITKIHLGLHQISKIK